MFIAKYYNASFHFNVIDRKLKDVGRMIREAGDRLDRDHTFQKLEKLCYIFFYIV